MISNKNNKNTWKPNARTLFVLRKSNIRQKPNSNSKRTIKSNRKTKTKTANNSSNNRKSGDTKQRKHNINCSRNNDIYTGNRRINAFRNRKIQNTTNTIHKNRRIHNSNKMGCWKTQASFWRQSFTRIIKHRNDKRANNEHNQRSKNSAVKTKTQLLFDSFFY